MVKVSTDREPAMSNELKVLGLLQNQWFKDPERSAKLLLQYQKHEGGYWPGRARFIRDMLFFGCLTGKRLEQTFGEDLCGYDGLIWEETSTELGGRSGSRFQVDGKHAAAALEYHRPRIIVTFGKVAEAALLTVEVRHWLENHSAEIVLAPHPVARGDSTITQLSKAAARTRNLLTALSLRSESDGENVYDSGD